MTQEEIVFNHLKLHGMINHRTCEKIGGGIHIQLPIHKLRKKYGDKSVKMLSTNTRGSNCHDWATYIYMRENVCELCGDSQKCKGKLLKNYGRTPDMKAPDNCYIKENLIFQHSRGHLSIFHKKLEKKEEQIEMF